MYDVEYWLYLLKCFPFFLTSAFIIFFFLMIFSYIYADLVYERNVTP